MGVECGHGHGDSERSRATRGALDTAGVVNEGSEPSVLPAFEPVAGGEPLRRVCGESLPAVLCGQAGATESGAGSLFSAAADRLFRRALTRSAGSLGGPKTRWRCGVFCGWG